MSISGFPIIINSSNVVSQTNNSVYNYTFNGTFTFVNKEIGVTSITIPYSWRNITSAYGNNKLSYTWIDGTVVNITIPDGFYQVSDLNNYLEFVFVQQGHYLIDNTGNYHYYMDLMDNDVLYAIQFDSYPLPATLPTGWSIPTGLSPSWSLLGYTANPQITIPSSNSIYKFSQIVGFTPGTYPSAQTPGATYSHTSDFTPQVSPVNSCIILCNLCVNKLASNTSVLGTFTPSDTGYGSNIVKDYPVIILTEMSPISTNQIQISIVDQNFQPMSILDNNLIVELIIKDK